MLDKSTIVTVVGFWDFVYPIIEYNETMTLGETLDFIEKTLEVEEYRTNPRFEANVYLSACTCIYSRYRGKLYIHEEFKDELGWLEELFEQKYAHKYVENEE